MNPWSASVEGLVEVLLMVGEALGGGRTLGTLVVTFSVRTALIPILLPIAARTKERQRVVRRIRPQIKALDREFRDDPSTLSVRLKSLHEDNGIGMVDWPGLIGAMIQLPVLIALFQAVLLVWEPRAMSPSGLGLGIVAAGLSLVATKISGQADGASWLLWLSGALPIAVCLWLGPGVALYLIAFYAAMSLQGVLMVRRGSPGSAGES